MTFLFGICLVLGKMRGKIVLLSVLNFYFQFELCSFLSHSNFFKVKLCRFGAYLFLKKMIEKVHYYLISIFISFFLKIFIYINMI